MKLPAIWQDCEEDEFRRGLDLGYSVCVILLLVALALPIYREYVYKARVAQIYYFILDFKTFVHEYYGERYQLPNDEKISDYLNSHDFLLENGDSKVTRFDITFKDGQYVVALESQDMEIHQKTLSFRPIVDSNKGTIIWLCGYDASLNDTSIQYSHLTTLPAKYLAGICKE